MILNGVCVIWRGWIDLQRLDGMGYLEYDEERAQVWHSHPHPLFTLSSSWNIITSVLNLPVIRKVNKRSLFVSMCAYLLRAAWGRFGPGSFRRGQTQNQRLWRQRPITQRGPGGERGLPLICYLRHNGTVASSLDLSQPCKARPRLKRLPWRALRFWCKGKRKKKTKNERWNWRALFLLCIWPQLFWLMGCSHKCLLLSSSSSSSSNDNHTLQCWSKHTHPEHTGTSLGLSENKNVKWMDNSHAAVVSVSLQLTCLDKMQISYRCFVCC